MTPVRKMNAKQLVGPLVELLKKSPTPPPDAPAALGHYTEITPAAARAMVRSGEVVHIHRDYLIRAVELLGGDLGPLSRLGTGPIDGEEGKGRTSK